MKIILFHLLLLFSPVVSSLLLIPSLLIASIFQILGISKIYIGKISDFISSFLTVYLMISMFNYFNIKFGFLAFSICLLSSFVASYSRFLKTKNEFDKISIIINLVAIISSYLIFK